MAHTVSARFEMVETQTGLWCNACMRSSGIRAVLSVAIGERFDVYDRSRCVDCGDPVVLPRPPARPSSDA